MIGFLGEYCFSFVTIFQKIVISFWMHGIKKIYRKYNESIKDMMSTLTRRRAQFNIYVSNSLVERILTYGGGRIL